MWNATNWQPGLRILKLPTTGWIKPCSPRRPRPKSSRDSRASQPISRYRDQPKPFSCPFVLYYFVIPDWLRSFPEPSTRTRRCCCQSCEVRSSPEIAVQHKVPARKPQSSPRQIARLYLRVRGCRLPPRDSIGREGRWRKTPIHSGEWSPLYKVRNRFSRKVPMSEPPRDRKHSSRAEDRSGNRTRLLIPPAGNDAYRPPLVPSVLWIDLSPESPDAATGKSCRQPEQPRSRGAFSPKSRASMPADQYAA